MVGSQLMIKSFVSRFVEPVGGRTIRIDTDVWK